MNQQEKQKYLDELIAKQKNGGLKPKDRYEIPPQDIPEQDATQRRSNVNEVALGYTELSS